MKIIDIGKCIDNKDPLGIGRIRFSRYNDYTGQVERALEYNAWDDKDIFVANPFLPNNINFIPEIGQSVKIITYNTERETVNIEYVSGPFNTMYDYNGQTFSQQVTHTTYGTINKRKPQIFSSDGKYVDKKTEHAFAKEKDFALYGKSGSDVLFTENGLILRGGKLLSKTAASDVNRQKLVDYPIMARKSSRLYLKKFPKKMVIQERLTKKNSEDSKNLKYIIEYTCKNNTSPSHSGELYADAENPMAIEFYVYKVLETYGETFKTNYFSKNTTFNNSTAKLINLDNTNSTPTHTIYVDSIRAAYIEIRNLIYAVHEGNLVKIHPLYSNEDVHPFYFKPTTEFNNRNFLDTGSTFNKVFILNNINVMKVGPDHGLIYDKSSAKPKSSTYEEIIEDAVILEDSPEQTFGAVTADKFYLLSTDLGENELENPVSFYDLNQYEYTQEDYIKKIDKNTYATVRGENLLRILRAMIDVIFTHRHNPLKSIVNQYDYTEGNDLKKLYETLENDILNKSIRIN